MAPDVVEKLVSEIEVKDATTAAHTSRVVLYFRAVLEEVGADRPVIRAATQAAALHDIGKLDIPREILAKPDRLTDAEFEVIKQHTVTGYARLADMDVDDAIILDLVRYHHEHWDGGGYPFGIAGEEIPVIARHFAVVDTFDALTSVRPYRAEVGEAAAEQAIEILEDASGTHYWPEAAELFIRLYRGGAFDWILENFHDTAELPTYRGDAEPPTRSSSMRNP